jgi:hypothetical protein
VWFEARQGRPRGAGASETDDCTVWDAAERDPSGSVRWEGLVARRLGPDRARLCATPSSVYDLNLGHEVALVESDEGALVVSGIAHDAGNYTFRVYRSSADDQWRRALDDRLGAVRLLVRHPKRRVPGPLRTARPRSGGADYLHERERRGEIRFETGRSRPRTGPRGQR